MNMRASVPSFLLTALLLTALVPIGTANATPTEASEFYYGVEYDWTSLDSDLTNFTGLDLPEMLGEVMGAADDAGFNLVVGQLLTGSSNVYVHHSENISPQTIQDMAGEDVTVWSRTDEVTLRHGVLFDGVLMTDWMEPASFGSSDDTSFDIDASTSGEQVLTVDVGYTEYLDEDYNLVGADMTFSMEVSVSNDIELDALFEGGGEELPIDFDAGISMSYAITESATQWRLGSPSPIYVQMSGNDYTEWSCIDEANGIPNNFTGVFENERVYDNCGEITGTYSGALDYSFSLTGLPTEDIGLDAGELDIELSDSVTESGTFESENLANTDITIISMGDDLTVDLGDGAGLTTSVAACTDCPPGNPLMFFMMGQVIIGASESFAESVAEDVADELSDSILDFFGDTAEESDEPSGNQWQCDSGDQWIYEWEVNDGYDDCYDGSDEMDMSGSWSGSGDNIYMIVDLDEEMLSFDEDGKMFMCDDGMEISWDQVNDGANDCANSEDEDEGRSEGDMFTCDDGTEIEWDAVNDYNSDCATEEDEGATGHYTVEAILTDAAGTPLSQQETTMCDANGCDTNMEWFYGNVGFDTETLSPTAYGEHTYCVSGMATDSSDGSVVMEFSSMCNDEFLGPQMGGNSNIYTDGMNVGFDASVYDWEENGNATFTVSIIDPSGNELFLDTMAIDGTEGYYNIADNVDVLEVGEYCVEMHMTQTGASEPYQSYTECELVEEGQEPSDRVVAIVEAMAESDLEEVLEQFGMNLEDRLSDVAPTEFPYNDGMWAPMWSSEHAAMVGVGVYAMDDDGAYIMAGPATQGYSDDAPVKMSIRYLTGVPASTAADEAEDANSIEDIVNVEDHDLGEISEALEEAGVDTSELDFPDSFTANETVNEDTPPQTAEELAEDAGLAGALPALSPISLIAVISLAGIVIGRRTEEA